MRAGHPKGQEPGPRLIRLRDVVPRKWEDPVSDAAHSDQAVDEEAGSDERILKLSLRKFGGAEVTRERMSSREAMHEVRRE